MNIYWDAFGLFETLLDNFESAIRTAEDNTKSDRLTKAIAVAKVGYIIFSPCESWNEIEDVYIADMIAGDLYEQSVEYGTPDCPEAVFLFACYGFGAMFGKLVANQISDAGHMAGILHFGAFRDMEFRRICDKYRDVLGILKNE